MPSARQPRAHLLALVAALSCAAVFPACADSAGEAKGPSSPRPFAADSFWNAPLPPDAPLDRLSAVYVADLRAQALAGAWINTASWSVPVYTVGRRERTVRVQLDAPYPEPALRAAWERVPIPAHARPAEGTDGWMVVWQPATDTLWEFWRMRRARDGWHAAWGGRLTGVSRSEGRYVDPPNWGASATSLPLLGGLMRIHELRERRIDHALAVALPRTRAGAWSWPAERTDGRVAGPLAIPQGTRFRIDPRVDLDRLPMAPVVRTMARAVQRYGMVVRDTSANVAFYAEDPRPGGRDPYPGLFGGRTPAQLLAQFPWQHLQALRTRVTTGSGQGR